MKFRLPTVHLALASTVSISGASAGYEPWLMGACAPDAQRFCRAEIESGNKIIECMRAHSAEFNPECKIPAADKKRLKLPPREPSPVPSLVLSPTAENAEYSPSITHPPKERVDLARKKSAAEAKSSSIPE